MDPAVPLAALDTTWVRGGMAAATAALAVGAAFVLVRGRRPDAGVPRQLPLAHLEELRRRLAASLLAVLVGVTFALTFRWEGWRGLWVPLPAVYDPMAAQAFSGAARHLVPPGVQLVVVRPMDAFMAEFWMALGLGLALALPVVLYQLGSFVAPALAPRERRVLLKALVPACLLFLAGAAFCYAVVLPATLRALYAFADPLGAAPLIGAADLGAFAFNFLLAFGIAFELPLVLWALARVGLLTASAGFRKWRHAVVAIVVGSAVLTPDPTLVSQLMMAGPLVVLYFAGLGLARAGERSFAASS